MNRNFRKILWVLLALLPCFIWGNSLLPGRVSSRGSTYVTEQIKPQVTAVQENLQEHGVSISARKLVRKAAHVAEYAALGWVLGLLLLKKGRPLRLLFGEGLCVAVACGDELLQSLTPGRNPSIKDVLLDACGGVLGLGAAVVFLLLLRAFVKKRKQN